MYCSEAEPYRMNEACIPSDHVAVCTVYAVSIHMCLEKTHRGRKKGRAIENVHIRCFHFDTHVRLCAITVEARPRITDLSPLTTRYHERFFTLSHLRHTRRLLHLPIRQEVFSILLEAVGRKLPRLVLQSAPWSPFKYLQNMWREASVLVT